MLKSPLITAGACAAIILGLLGPPSVRAIASPFPPGVAHASHNKPVPRRIVGDTTYYCIFTAEEPFWLTHESSVLYGQGRIAKCSSPAPTGCHMIVDLEELKEIGGIYRWEVMKTGDKGWIPCTTKGSNSYTNAPYKCQSVLSDYPFRSVVTLAIEFPGGTGDGKPAVSGSVLKACE